MNLVVANQQKRRAEQYLDKIAIRSESDPLYLEGRLRADELSLLLAHGGGEVGLVIDQEEGQGGHQGRCNAHV